jgi:transposase-like protein
VNRRSTFSLEQREKILNELEQSDLSVGEFARQNGLSRVLLSVWRLRYRRKPPGEPPPGPSPRTEGLAVGALPFQEIGLSQVLGQTQTRWAAELVLPAGVTVRLDPQGRDRLLGHLLDKEQSPC